MGSNPELVQALRDLSKPDEEPQPKENVARNVDLTFCFDGGGAAITVGMKCFLVLDFPCRISGWTVVADQSGSILFDLTGGLYADFPSLVSLTGGPSYRPGLTGAQKNMAEGVDISTWDRTLPRRAVVEANVASVATVQVVTLTVRAKRLDI